MKRIRGILFLAFGVFCLAGVYLFASGTMDPPQGQTMGPINYIFGIFVAAASFFCGYQDIKAGRSKNKEDKGDVPTN